MNGYGYDNVSKEIDMNEMKYYQLIGDLWRLLRQFIKQKNQKGQISWSQFEAKAVMFYELHGNTQFAKDLAFAVADELERREMKQK